MVNTLGGITTLQRLNTIKKCVQKKIISNNTNKVELAHISKQRCTQRSHSDNKDY